MTDDAMTPREPQPFPDFDPERVAFATSGDPEKDADTAADIRRHLRNESEGLCPNGCGPIEYIDERERRCPVCGFVGITTKLYLGGEHE